MIRSAARPVSRAAAVCLLALLTGGWPVTSAGAGADEWKAKVHPLVLERAAVESPVEFIIFLDEQADLSAAAERQTKQERGTRVFEVLTEVAARTQAPLIELLEARGLEYRSFWIANMIWVRGDFEDLATLAAHERVQRVDANPGVQMEEPMPQADGEEPLSPSTIEWGVLNVAAYKVWAALGNTGEGIVIGGQDTGYEWTHPALIQQYRGWNGSVADHAYNWHDSIHTDGGSCGADTSEPCDDHGHGTHTMGTMVGDDGGANQIGVSPGARWMGCRNMKEATGTPASYSECFEWFVAPTDADGLNPNPSMAPHVINNSWHCPPSEGCSFDMLQTVVENTRAAGIVVVAAAGNSGSECSTVVSPPAIYEASLSVGATSNANEVVSFSSRGLVEIDGSHRLKPDVVAPGLNVRSSVPGDGYAVFHGTSMAAPHVAGVIGLLLSEYPALIGDPDSIEGIVKLSAVPGTSIQECGGIPGTVIPNPVYGYGRVDAFEAIIGDADGDGLNNGVDCAPVNATVWDSPDPAVDLQFSQNGFVTALDWAAPTFGGATALRYDVLRSTAANDFSSPTCVATGTPLTAASDDDNPGGLQFYLVRTKNACGTHLGNSSTGMARSGGSCP